MRRQGGLGALTPLLLVVVVGVLAAPAAGQQAPPSPADPTAALPGGAASPAAVPPAQPPQGAATPPSPASLPQPPPKIDSGDTAWMLTAATLVLMMTIPGLALFYGGMVRRQNVLGTMMQSFIIVALISLQWALWGYSLAFGPDIRGLIGSLAWFGLKDVGLGPYPDYAGTIPHQVFMIYQLMFAIITPALITGAFAERMRFGAFLVFTLLWTTCIYDPLAHWVWGVGGWLRSLGALDFAGGTVVHISSGVSALAAALVLGKRRGFGVEPMPPHSLPLTVTGAAMLWVGWFGFNAGSALGSGPLAASAFVVTHLATAAATFAWMLTEWIVRGRPTVLGAASGAVAGLVAITPASGFVGPLSAVLIGAVAGNLCYNACNLKAKVGYDDSLDVVGVHGIGGTWGALATGLFASKAVNEAGNNGVFFGNPELFRAQVIAVLATWAFAFVGSLILLKLVDALIGLRVHEEDEVMGLDLSQHNESAYALGIVGTTGFGAGLGALESPRAPARKPAEAAARRLPAAEVGPGAGSRGRTPPTATGQSSRTPPVASAAPAGARETGPAVVERGAAVHIKDRPFKIVLRDVDKRHLREVWEELCHGYPQSTPPDFNDIYQYVSTFTGDSLAFQRGDPARFREKVERLLREHGVSCAGVSLG